MPAACGTPNSILEPMLFHFKGAASVLNALTESEAGVPSLIKYSVLASTVYTLLFRPALPGSSVPKMGSIVTPMSAFRFSNWVVVQTEPLPVLRKVLSVSSSKWINSADNGVQTAMPQQSSKEERRIPGSPYSHSTSMRLLSATSASR